jgi:hypothetical protein
MHLAGVFLRTYMERDAQYIKHTKSDMIYSKSRNICNKK